MFYIMQLLKQSSTQVSETHLFRIIKKVTEFFIQRKNGRWFVALRKDDFN